jgi:hypothetical protein
MIVSSFDEAPTLIATRASKFVTSNREFKCQLRVLAKVAGLFEIVGHTNSWVIARAHAYIFNHEAHVRRIVDGGVKSLRVSRLQEW